MAQKAWLKKLPIMPKKSNHPDDNFLSSFLKHHQGPLTPSSLLKLSEQAGYFQETIFPLTQDLAFVMTKHIINVLFKKHLITQDKQKLLLHRDGTVVAISTLIHMMATFISFVRPDMTEKEFHHLMKSIHAILDDNTNRIIKETQR